MPMLDSYIATITHARTMTLKLVADLSDDQMTFQPAPKVNHPAWVLGHLMQVDAAFLSLVTRKPNPEWLNDEWKAIYGQKSEPVSDKSKYRSKSFYVEQLTSLRTQILEGLKAMKPADFQAPHPDPARRERFPTVGHAVMLYGTWHEAYHAGQLSTWRRVQGLTAV